MLCIYDNSGKIISARESADWTPDGVPYMVIESRDGYTLSHIDVSTDEHTPVWVAEPKIETTQEVLQAVREQISLIADVVDTLLFAEEVTDNA